MKYLIKLTSFIFLITVFSACKTQKGTIEDTNATNQSEGPAKMVTVSGVFSEEYCGGAPPTDEMVEEMEKEKPFTNQELHIYTIGLGEGEYFKVKTGSDGTFKKRLAPGSYFIYTMNKESYDKLIESTTDKHIKECLRAHFIAPISSFDVVKGETETEFFYRKMCNPCEPPRP